MKIILSIFIVSLIQRKSLAQDSNCSELQALCNNDPNCQAPGQQAALCIQNDPPYNNTFGCDKPEDQNIAYVNSCYYNCYYNASLTTNDTTFQNLTDCVVNQNVGDVCQGQLINCYNTNANQLNCVGSLNTYYNCINNNVSLAGCEQANEPNAETLYPAYLAQCSYSCYQNMIGNNNTVFQSAYGCLTAAQLSFPQQVCNTQFISCLADTTGLCATYLNQATILVDNNSTCTGSSSNNNAVFIQTCANATYVSVNTTANPSPTFTNLTNCLSTFNGNSPTPTPTPTPTPSPTNSSQSASNSTSSSSSTTGVFGKVFALISILVLLLIGY